MASPFDELRKKQAVEKRKQESPFDKLRRDQGLAEAPVNPFDALRGGPVVEAPVDPFARLRGEEVAPVEEPQAPKAMAEVEKAAAELAVIPGIEADQDLYDRLVAGAKDAGKTSLSALGGVLDLLQRGNFAVARAAHEMLDDDEKNVFQDLGDAILGVGEEVFSGLGGIQGEKTIWADVLKDDLHLQPLFKASEIPGLRGLFTETGDGIFRFKRGGFLDVDTNDVLGFTLDVVLDPLTYVTGGASGFTKFGKVEKAATFLEEIPEEILEHVARAIKRGKGGVAMTDAVAMTRAKSLILRRFDELESLGLRPAQVKRLREFTDEARSSLEEMVAKSRQLSDRNAPGGEFWEARMALEEGRMKWEAIDSGMLRIDEFTARRAPQELRKIQGEMIDLGDAIKRSEKELDELMLTLEEHTRAGGLLSAVDDATMRVPYAINEGAVSDYGRLLYAADSIVKGAKARNLTVPAGLRWMGKPIPGTDKLIPAADRFAASFFDHFPGMKRVGEAVVSNGQRVMNWGRNTFQARKTKDDAWLKISARILGEANGETFRLKQHLGSELYAPLKTDTGKISLGTRETVHARRQEAIAERARIETMVSDPQRKARLLDDLEQYDALTDDLEKTAGTININDDIVDTLGDAVNMTKLGEEWAEKNPAVHRLIVDSQDQYTRLLAEENTVTRKLIEDGLEVRGEADILSGRSEDAATALRAMQRGDLAQAVARTTDDAILWFTEDADKITAMLDTVSAKLGKAEADVLIERLPTGGIRTALPRTEFKRLMREAGFKPEKWIVRDLREHLLLTANHVYALKAQGRLKQALVSRFGDAAKLTNLRALRAFDTLATPIKGADQMRVRSALSAMTDAVNTFATGAKPSPFGKGGVTWTNLSELEKREFMRMLFNNEAAAEGGTGILDALIAVLPAGTERRVFEDTPAMALGLLADSKIRDQLDAFILMKGSKEFKGVADMQAQARRTLPTVEEASAFAPKPARLSARIAEDTTKYRQLNLGTQRKLVDGELVDFVVDVEVPESIFNDYQALTGSLRGNPEVRKAIRQFDKFNNLVKMNLTAIGGFPSFQVRNGYSNVALAWTAAHLQALNPRKQLRAWQVLGAASDKKLFKKLFKPDDLNKVLLTARTGRKYTVADLARIFQDHGVVVDAEMLAEFTGKRAAFDLSLGKLPKGRKAAGKAVRNFNALFEETTRAQLMMVYLERGLDPVDAVREVNKYLFDYQALSAFEKSVMKRIFPFYTFYRKAVPLMVRSVFERPGAMGLQAKLLREHENDLGPRAVFGTQFGERVVVERDGSVYALGSVDLPINSLKFLDVLRAPVDAMRGPAGERRAKDAFKEIASMFHPLISTSIEMGTGLSLFRERPEDQRRINRVGEMLFKVTKGKPELRRYLGLAKKEGYKGETNYYFNVPQWKLLVDGTGVGRILSGLERGLTASEDTLGKGEAITLLRFLSGLNYQEMSLDEADARQLREFEDNLEQLLLRLGARRKFTTTYNPKDAEADPYGVNE